MEESVFLILGLYKLFNTNVKTKQMASYNGHAQRLHLALLDSDLWSRSPHSLSTCHVIITSAFPATLSLTLKGNLTMLHITRLLGLPCSVY